MILELDCGNSFIKWRVIAGDGAERIAGGVVDADSVLIDAVKGIAGLQLEHCRLVSVRNEDETERLVAALATELNVQAMVALPAQVLAGVRNGYEAFERLGLDRWVALVAGFRLAGRACVVIDLGTAVTSDFVAADGEHIGGFICPGLPLMRGQLRTHTRKIRYDDQSAERAHLSLQPGRNTVEAVERGCTLMMRGFVASQVEQAGRLWGDDFTLFLTGGDAGLVSDVVPAAQVVPDLVFVGLAIACPIV
ncbi:pantothenate kinase [Pseudomonas eucalypticola]|uniref:Type III pantothenate kinase n=1 Tax=Pseudomonas eucalypticola TaxID=2599595 RepID=A0A7D5DAY7_9PSED|nr:pantothenate kinase [Pseudomonas eucalypticola]QKZ07038.1 pantothenate kinase [Pseudomonas eucalypticola]